MWSFCKGESTSSLVKIAQDPCIKAMFIWSRMLMVLSSPCYVFLPVVHSTGMHVLKIKGKTRRLQC